MKLTNDLPSLSLSTINKPTNYDSMETNKFIFDHCSFANSLEYLVLVHLELLCPCKMLWVFMNYLGPFIIITCKSTGEVGQWIVDVASVRYLQITISKDRALAPFAKDQPIFIRWSILLLQVQRKQEEHTHLILILKVAKIRMITFVVDSCLPDSEVSSEENPGFLAFYLTVIFLILHLDYLSD